MTRTRPLGDLIERAIDVLNGLDGDCDLAPWLGADFMEGPEDDEPNDNGLGDGDGYSEQLGAAL